MLLVRDWAVPVYSVQVAERGQVLELAVVMAQVVCQVLELVRERSEPEGLAAV